MKKLFTSLIIALFLLSSVSAAEWEWVQVKDLKVGDSLMDKDGNDLIEIHGRNGAI